MNKQFVTYEIALKLKELGFNEKCLGYFNRKGELICGINVSDEAFLFTNIGKAPNCCLAPLWQQVIDWFREKYNIHIWIYYDMVFENSYYQIRHEINKSEYNHYCNDHIDKTNFNKSREQSILKAIELINKQ